MTTKKDLATQQPRDVAPADTGMTLVEKAIDKGLDPDALGKLMDLAERQTREVARQAWHNAMQEFQGKCPVIARESKTPNYKYASLSTIMAAIRPTLAECGLSIMFDETTADSIRHTTCKVMHVSGHTETATFSGPDQAKLHGGANTLQQAGAAQSYGRRYALIMALNLTSVDPDDEARMARPVDTITDDEAADLESRIDSSGANRPKFLEYFGIEKEGELPADRFDEACKRLAQVAKRNAAKAKEAGE